MKTKYKKIISYLIISQMFLLAFIMGLGANFTVVAEHKGKMPVYYGYFYETDEEHFVYTEKKGVEMWYLTDIIPIWNYMVSPGDIFLFLGAGGYLTFNLLTVYELRRKR